MTYCNLCQTEYAVPDYSHEKCREEYRDRHAHGECVKCKKPSGRSLYCVNCNSDSQYRGYPGGPA